MYNFCIQVAVVQVKFTCETDSECVSMMSVLFLAYVKDLM